MKSTIICLIALFSFQTLASDMSRTETYDEAYRELSDGSNEYIGGCSTHQDYEGKKFIVTKTLVKYFEPRDFSKSELANKLKTVEKELIEKIGGLEFIADADDLTLEKIQHKNLKHLDLYRANIGVGGGNGYYEVYARTKVKGVVKYLVLSHVFDGDIEYCDSLVWNK